MTHIEITLATIDDVGRIAPLFDAYRQFYEQTPDLTLATQFVRQRLARQESVILLAQHNGPELLGFCQLYPTFCSVEAAPIYALYDLYVQPSARRLGVGQALLRAAEAHAAAQGMRRMDLTTAKTNASAQALYESLGWIRDEVFFAYNKAVCAAGGGASGA